jgi:HAD superfamily hydrolase (TIGR01549 family)
MSIIQDFNYNIGYMQKNTVPEKKISVIIPAYNAETSITATIESLLKQTYKNLEIIIVNDGSTDGTKEYGEKLEKSHDNIRLLTLGKNSGLFKARLEGADIATGDYIAFLDADDYVSIDYYRNLLDVAEKTSSDMILSEVVIDERNIDRLFINNIANDLPFSEINNPDGFHEYMDQRGHNFIWHGAWNKLIRKDLWDKARPHYDLVKKHLIMTEDVAISTPLWYFANKVSRSQTSYHFYVKDDEGGASTALGGLGFKKAEKSLTDMQTAFSFVDTFFEQNNISKFYTDALYDWKKQYVRIWHSNVEGSSAISSSEKKSLAAILDSIASFNPDETNLDSKFYEITTDWNDGLEKIKEQIIKHDTISFDIFDTLVLRPFLTPSDIFNLLNSTFAETCPEVTVLRFYDIRIEAEQIARKNSKDPDTIDIHDIYEVIKSRFAISDSVAEVMMSAETALEIKYCTQRKTGYELFSLAKSLNKKVLLVSDMYLQRDTIEKILKNNSYEDWDRLYISSEEKASKSNGDLYDTVLSDSKLTKNQVLHIGDSLYSDIEQAKKHGLTTAHIPRTIDAFMSKKGIADLYNLRKGSLAAHIGKEYLGVSASLAIIANHHFDNPFISFNENSIFNGSPSNMGYFALGMHTLGLSLWLHNATEAHKYRNFVFLGRDGYLPQQGFSTLLQSLNTNTVSSHYMPTSRKATTPLSVRSLQDIQHIRTFITPGNKTVSDALNILDPILETDRINVALKAQGVNSKDILTEENYDDFIEVIRNSFDIKKSRKLQEAFIHTFGPILKNSAVFDIGYSAKPEQIFSKVTGYGIDTYFIHTYGEGQSRSRKHNGISLHNFYDFSPVVTGGLRELLISEVGPSAVKYIAENNKLTVQYDKNFHTEYYERYTVQTMQREAIRFISDFLQNFKDYIPDFTFTNRYISLPYEELLNHPTVIDRKIFAPIPFEDDIGIGKIGSILDIPTLQESHLPSSLHHLLIGTSKLKKGIVYLVLDPLHIVHRTRDAVSVRLKKHPKIHRTAKKFYHKTKRIVRKK